VLWLIWRVRTPVEPQVETFASVMFFFQESASHRTDSSRAAAHTVRKSIRAPAPQPAESATANTLPATPAARIDWSAQLERSARAELDQEEKAGKQLTALTRRFVVEADPLNPGRAPASTFHWYEAGIHRIDTRGPLPVLLLNDHCALLMFIIPACRIGHIEIHGDLFDGAAAANGDRLATPRPNDVP